MEEQPFQQMIKEQLDIHGQKIFPQNNHQKAQPKYHTYKNLVKIEECVFSVKYKIIKVLEKN